MGTAAVIAVAVLGALYGLRRAPAQHRPALHIVALVLATTGAATAAVGQLKTVLNRFIEALAVMLVTSCLIPILVLLFFAWLVKLMLGIELPPLRVKLGDGKVHSTSGAPRI